MKIEKDYIMNDQKDLLAKLLATENITVVRGNASTASFNTQTRVLTLPLWKDMTIEQEEMLIGHEVGHALYTTNDYMEDLKSSRALMSYMNVIEDVRIEKFIKKKYPGLKKSFSVAYKQLQEKDFFGIADKKLDTLLFIDRANLYFKAGFNCGVKFTTEEASWLRKIDSCETMKDVYELAVELLGWTREERQKQKDLLAQKIAMNGPEEEIEEDNDDDFNDDFADDLYDDLDDEDEDESDADGDSDEQGDENGSTENDSNGKSEEDSKSSDTKPEQGTGTESVNSKAVESITQIKEEVDECESITDKNLSQNLAESADTSIVYQNIKYDENVFLYNPVVDYKTVLKELQADYNSWRVNDYREFFINREKDADKFMNDCKKEVAYLVKEFEMKKQAARYARAQTSKSGEIEVKKLYAYKLKEDLFKRVTTLPDGKNHGMVMLVDWSGSMQPTMYDTLKQTVILAMFCAKIQIPYKVFAFTNGRRLDDDNQSKVNSSREAFWEKAKTECVMSMDSHFHLIEFFSNGMRANEFKQMARYVLIGPFNFSDRYGMHSTPLNEALMYMQSYMGKFIKENNVQIPTFITLTDGEGHSLDIQSPIYRDEQGNRKEVKYTLVDPITKKIYKNFRYGTDQTKSLLRMLKDRYNCNTVGFHILRNNRREIYSFINANLNTKNAQGYYETEKLIADFRSNFRTEGFINVDQSYRDAMFVIPSNKLKIEDGDLEVDGKMTANQIARKFTKHLDTRRTSKVLLNQFVGMVA